MNSSLITLKRKDSFFLAACTGHRLSARIPGPFFILVLYLSLVYGQEKDCQEIFSGILYLLLKITVFPALHSSVQRPGTLSRN